ncbi:MAG: MarR family transcriptional regulator [Terracidiphilus sp.]|nr:MarR family transcriptional regulator [Terracidiphilus sp.]
MNSQSRVAGQDSLIQTLAEFRFEIRRFLQFSESAAVEAGLQPQQHQLLLQVAGAPKETTVSIAYAAERLGLKHNSTVELVDRSEREGLLTRTADPNDKRRAILLVTRKGNQILGRLSGDHARELNELAPRLVQALKNIRLHERAAVSAGDR